MKLYRTSNGVFVEENDNFYLLPMADWDDLISSSNLYLKAGAAIRDRVPSNLDPATALAPLRTPGGWAAGVTYDRSRNGDRREQG